MTPDATDNAGASPGLDEAPHRQWTWQYATLLVATLVLAIWEAAFCGWPWVLGNVPLMTIPLGVVVWQRRRLFGRRLVIVGIVLFIPGFVVAAHLHHDIGNRPGEATRATEACEAAVREQLVNPERAELLDLPPEKNDTGFFIRGTVDSRDRAGALLHSVWLCQADRKGNRYVAEVTVVDR